MPFLQIRVLSRYPELAEEVLLGRGASSVSMVDAEDDPVLEPAPGETPLWSRTETLGLFDGSADVEGAAQQLRELLPDGAEAEVAIERVEDQDWIRAWLDEWKPLKFGKRLWVCPNEKRVDEPGCATLVLDPGLAFGTGTHPSTALCLEWIARADVTGASIVDFGCGSGILGIAALLLGAKHCTSTDIDPQAIQATRANARENGIEPTRLRVIEHDATFMPFLADALFANILARPLIQLAPLFASSLRKGGRVVLAGLLERQAEEVRAAYAPWFDFDPDGQHEGWVRIVGSRR